MARSGNTLAIPTSFKLGANTWRVRYRKMPGVHGMCEADKHTIYLNPEQKPKDLYSTYLHELTHAILFTMGYDEEEKFVAAYEQLLLQVMTTQRHSKTTRKSCDITNKPLT